MAWETEAKLEEVPEVGTVEEDRAGATEVTVVEVTEMEEVAGMAVAVLAAVVELADQADNEAGQVDMAGSVHVVEKTEAMAAVMGKEVVALTDVAMVEVSEERKEEV